MLQFILIAAILVILLAGMLLVTRHHGGPIITPRQTRHALPKPGMPWHELDRIMKNDRPERK